MHLIYSPDHTLLMIRALIGGGELRGHLVSVGKFTASDADWIVKEMQRVGNIKKVALDTFRRVS